MQTIETKNNLIYGPVNSRRLGKSLGVNILPKGLKYCTFNCVYCHYGWTKIKVNHDILSPEITFPSVEKVRDALKDSLLSLKSQNLLPVFITFSGNGEPALHPDFHEIVIEVNKLRDEISPESKTAILSNSTEINRSEIQKALNQIDIRIMKLDCANQEIFSVYNKPYPELSIDNIVKGLIYMSETKPVYIQTLFTSGKKGNLTEENINEWISHLVKIKPGMVQIYSLSRGYPEKEISPVSKDNLLRIYYRLKEAGISSVVY